MAGSAAAGWFVDFVCDWLLEAASELEAEPSDEPVVAEVSVVDELSVEVEEDDAAGITALTALWQADDSLATFFSRHCSAAEPPGDTPAQWLWKSLGQAERIACCCAAVGVAEAVPAKPSKRPAEMNKPDAVSLMFK